MPDLSTAPSMVLNRPLIIRDVVLSKFHSAVLTTDPVSNLYICGVGRGGRLGLGDENTRFNYVPVQGGLSEKSIAQVALGQNHTMAVTDSGELWTWGSNANSQLGYTLPAPMKKDEEPSSTSPRQVFGPLKKESILGVAASALHSVAHTGLSLYCWGKNIGQLALMDADSRSLDVQTVPRKVAASLFPSPIVTVSAIDKATTCLLANHTVVCFASYGYNIVKFPPADSLSNYRPSSASMSTRYEASRNQIQHITSGGETVAALTARGDLYTFGLNQRPDANATATSTTNPSKIKGAITQPQCVWSARREGVRSVGVGEHGSVIICTESGAAWRRVKRAKAKDAYVHHFSEAKRKDFKFQRVPYITKVVSVRASPFGTFAAVRGDVDVMRKQIAVAGPSLWDDLAPLNPLCDFQASEPGPEDKDTHKFWDAGTLEKRLGSIAYEILKSPDLDADLRRHLTTFSYQNEPLGAVLRTSLSPDLGIPVHSWLLSARSSTIRTAMAQHRKTQQPYTHGDTFRVEVESGLIVITVLGLDLMSVLNLVLYMYCDRVIPAWNYTRQAPPLAHRYRQIRSELMKVAARLEMPKLEAAVRLQTEPKRSMDEDFRRAIKDRRFFEDGDALLELDGLEIPVHSALVCQRCPWFEGLFHGRSGGMWLADRRERQGSADPVRIDLKHVEPATFKYVLEHIYSDSGEDLFDAVVAASTDDLMDLIMDVLATANELMLDRLSEICQKVMGKFVNTRNISHLLNAISPCSVTEFKDAGLEYICLQIESMLENHLLDDLDEDLLLELDAVVRDNQLARFPFARSGRAELLLHERYPELAQDIDEERQRRVREIAFKAALKDEERKLSSSFKAKYGSHDDPFTIAPSPDRLGKASRARNEPFSPSLKAQASHGDLMFDMDEEAEGQIGSPLPRLNKSSDTAPSSAPDVAAAQLKPRAAVDQHTRSPNPNTSPAGSPASCVQPTRAVRIDAASSPTSAPRSGNPWGPAPLPTAKRQLSEIIQSESATNKSALSAGLAAQKIKNDPPPSKPAQSKLSQKERKKQQTEAAQAAQAAATPKSSRAAWDRSAESSQTPPPWKPIPSRGKAPGPGGTPNPKPLVAAESSSGSAPRRTASPDTRFSGQTRSSGNVAAPINTPRAPVKPNAPPTSTPNKLPPPSSSSHASQQQQHQQQPLVPHSKSYITPTRKADSSLGASMADIIGQQQREQEIVKEAVAKRSLQEIQQEQAFQEWWDAESRRAQEEEARRLGREKEKHEGPKRRARRGKAGKTSVAAAGAGREEASGSSSAAVEGPGKRGKGGRGGGRGGEKEAARQ